MNDFLDKLLSGLKTIAPTVANLALPGSGILVESLMRSVSGEPIETPLDQVAQKIMADPKLYIDLQRQAMEHEALLADIEAKKLATVNTTMQAEAASEHWPQYSWRPFNGFLYGPAIILIYFCLPLFDKAIPSVPEWIWMGWAAVLGVATWDRGKEKRVKSGESSPGLLVGAIQAIRGQ